MFHNSSFEVPFGLSNVLHLALVTGEEIYDVGSVAVSFIGRVDGSKVGRFVESLEGRLRVDEVTGFAFWFVARYSGVIVYYISFEFEVVFRMKGLIINRARRTRVF